MSETSVASNSVPPPTNMAFVSHSGNWEELRRESRRLENEIDTKLVSFGKLSSSFLRRESSSGAHPVVGNPGHVFETMCLEIEQLLKKLRNVNESMNEYMARSGVPSPTAALHHTLQRHNEILQDYAQEYNRTKSNITAHRQREELLGSSRQDRSKQNSALNRRTELYLKEHDHLRSSDRLTDEAISIAINTRENLSQQRTVFSGVTSRMQDITHRFPLINSLVQRINLRKRRDSIILGGVIAVCIIILLLIALR